MNLTGPQAGSDVDALTMRALTTRALTMRALTTRALATGAESLAQCTAVSALSVDPKLALPGSPTCVMAQDSVMAQVSVTAQDNVTGDLISGENGCMRIRFLRMDITRLSVGMQELAITGTGTGNAALARALFFPSDGERAR